MRTTNAFIDGNGRPSLFVVSALDPTQPVIVTGVSLTNANAVHVAIVDGSGNQIISFGGGTQYANGSAQATPTGTVALGWDGANVRALSTDSTGKLQLGTVTISGTVTANAGTNLNTSALALETGGNLATIAGAVSSSKMNVNVSSVTSGAAIQLLDSGGTNKLAINASGQVTISNSGFNVNNTPSVSQSGTWNVGLSAGSNNIGGVEIIDSGGTNKLSINASGQITLSNTGFNVNNTPAVTQSGTWTVQPGNTQNTTPWLSAPSANTGAVAPTPSYQSALTNTKVAVKASAGNYYGHHIYNPNSVVTYIQLFNKATGSVTLGSTTPDWVLIVPPQGILDDLSFQIPVWGFGTALTLAATTGAANNTAPTNTLVATFFYL